MELATSKAAEDVPSIIECNYNNEINALRLDLGQVVNVRGQMANRTPRREGTYEQKAS